MKGWLTIAEAAKRVEKSEDTIYRWGREKLVRIVGGRVLETQLLAADAMKRKAVGRPRALRDERRRTVPLKVNGQVIGTAVVDLKTGMMTAEVTDPRVLAALSDSPRIALLKRDE